MHFRLNLDIKALLVKKIVCSCLALLLLLVHVNAQTSEPGQTKFTHADTLRGSVTPERAWWDVTHYDLQVAFNFNQKSLKGSNTIDFKILKASSKKMQIDLQSGLNIDSVVSGTAKLQFSRKGNVYYINWPHHNKESQGKLKIYYGGLPREAKRPPWDGGVIWKTDKLGHPWITVTCQGWGASVWYPCKDYQGDEPDSASLTLTVPDSLIGVGNGRLRSKVPAGNGLVAYTWAVVNPINCYNIIPYIGRYMHWGESYEGEKGKLDCDFWALEEDSLQAKTQFGQVMPMLKCFEHWFGPYPFYEDGYKLVEAPHLGMEHQSAIAYGNKFQNGYRGDDLSGTGWGLKWDFIIVHESGHEWFGNNITTKDIADMWVHESFTNYSETLFTQCQFGKEAGDDYAIGTRKKIENKFPIIGRYDVNNEGPVDMYYKGGNMLHTIRQVINNDDKFRQILRGLNSQFYHKTVDGKDIQNYISSQSGINFNTVFEQYLTTTQIPVFEFRANGAGFQYRYTNTVNGFNLPLKIYTDKEEWISPNANWQQLQTRSKQLTVDRNFYVEPREMQ